MGVQHESVASMPASHNKGSAMTKLDSRVLMEAAERETGLSDWGTDQTHREPLDVLLSALNNMTAPDDFWTRSAQRLAGSLAVKLQFIEDEKRNPEVLKQSIDRPLVVIGLPRTGTTIMYDLLALNPAFRCPREWEFYWPWPAPEAATWSRDPRIAQLAKIYDHMLEVAPELANIADFSTDHPSECNLAFCHQFASMNFTAEWGVPEYEHWLVKGPIAGRYPAHKRILQQLQWKGPKGRWLLKSPEHLFDLDGLLGAYPNASMVWTHRDPVMAFSSLSSFLLQFRNIHGLNNDTKVIGRSVVNQWATALERGMQARERSPQIDEKIIDIAHKDVIADKIAVLKRIYAHSGQPFPDELADKINTEAATGDVQRFGRLGKHKHDPVVFGIDAAEVKERMPLYYARFGHLFGSTC